MFRLTLIVLAFSWLSVGGFSTVEAAGYSLQNGLEDLGSPDYPKHLVDAEETKELAGNASDITRFIQKIANGITTVAASIAVFFIVYNAFGLVKSAGDSDSIGNSKKGLIWSLAGLALIMFAYVLVKTIISIIYSGDILQTVT
jgi:predicted cobalt transporter CbtA